MVIIPDNADHGYRVEPYTGEIRVWLGRTDHYLGNPPPGAMYAITVRALVDGLFGPLPGGALLGVVVVGRPVAPKLPQDGSVGQISRMWLAPGLPRGTASNVLRLAIVAAWLRGCVALITYHDRTRHTGCVYRKAGFRKDGTVNPGALGWDSRPDRVSAGYAPTPKRRWRVDLR